MNTAGGALLVERALEVSTPDRRDPSVSKLTVTSDCSVKRPSTSRISSVPASPNAQTSSAALSVEPPENT